MTSISNILCNSAGINVIPRGNQCANSSTVWTIHLCVVRVLACIEVSFPATCMENMSANQSANSFMMRKCALTDRTGFIQSFIEDRYRIICSSTRRTFLISRDIGNSCISQGSHFHHCRRRRRRHFREQTRWTRITCRHLCRQHRSNYRDFRCLLSGLIPMAVVEVHPALHAAYPVHYVLMLRSKVESVATNVAWMVV